MSKLKDQLKKQLEHVKYYNNLAPFPVYDTGYVEDIENKLKEMEGNEKDYDSLPVVACKYCKSLWIENDDVENEHCMRCGSINDTVIKSNIEEYLTWKEEDGESK